MSQMIISYPCVGWSRYQYNGREGFYLNVVEQHPQDDKNAAGSFQTAISAPYAESAKVTGVVMNLAAPATVELKCRMVSRAGSTSLVCDEITSVKPFVASAVQPAPSAPNAEPKAK
jgi:hypothetical protein